jgi:type IV secretory pathway TrbL component
MNIRRKVILSLPLLVVLLIATAGEVYASGVGAGVSSTIAGGLNNLADGDYSSIGGGRNNLAKKVDSTVGGGRSNKAKGPQSTVSDGKSNVTSGKYSTVIGGLKNTASGNSATVAGGEDNIASGGVSFAAGQRAHAAHDGTFVWADASGEDTSSTGDNQFIIRANGGVGINTSSAAMDELNLSETDGSVDAEIAFIYTGSGGHSRSLSHWRTRRWHFER